MNFEEIISTARETFDTEIEGLQFVRDAIDGAFVELVMKALTIIENGGKIVVTGMGKSGHIGRKISATLASVGAPSVFMHPAEAMHGDLGIIQSSDLLLILSYSGESDELVDLIPAVKRFDIPIAAVTGSKSSSLAKWSDIIVDVAVPREACPFNLAPTTTTTAMLALGDALAMVLLNIMKFTKEDYGRLHPGGAIGKAVTVKVSDIMRTGERLVLVGPNASVRDTILKMTKARSGSAVIVDDAGNLLGIFTDGDFRRHAENDMEILDKATLGLMTRNPASVSCGDLAVKILKIIETKHIDDIVVLDANKKVVGLVDVQDLPGFKLM
jgi:arabinose-5-phosphate isomerase